MVLKYLEKIGEITSIQVAKERLALAVEQLQAKEKECDQLRGEVERLRAENDRLTDESGRQSKSVEENSGQTDEPVELVDEQVKIVQSLFNRGPRGLTLERIAEELGVKPSLAQYHVDALKREELIDTIALIVGQGLFYGLTERGRAYAVEQGIVD